MPLRSLRDGLDSSKIWTSLKSYYKKKKKRRGPKKLYYSFIELNIIY